MNEVSKTKLVITLGPSTDKLLGIDLKERKVDKEVLSVGFDALVDAGVDVFRFNMSHGTFDDHELRLNALQKCNEKSFRQTAILIDTKGPEIRVGQMQSEQPEANIIQPNDVVIIECLDHSFLGSKNRFWVTDATGKYNMAQDLSLRQLIYLDDGKLVLKVMSLDPQKGIVKARCLSEARELKSNKRINLVNTKYSLPFLSKYDIETIKKAVEWNAEFLALSFVSSVKEINEVKKIISSVNPNSNLKLIAKIETPEALTNITEIINNTDGVMVARGDLALEIGFEKVPYWEEKIIRLCNLQRKVVIVATQMLDSLETNNIPTRAETMDCYYAAKLLTNSTMLSGESASGHDPLNAVNMMKKITNEADEVNCKEVNEVYQDYTLSEPEQAFINEFKKALRANRKIVHLVGFSETELQLICQQNFDQHFILFDKKAKLDKSMVLYRNLSLYTQENYSLTNKIVEKSFLISRKNIKI